MNDPLISICIPTYKNVEYLQRLLQSITRQTFKDYEIVITDNSPDNSVEELAKNFTELSIRYYKNIPPTNMAENFNLVLQKAQGKWTKMMHDDDWFSSSESLQKFADTALKTSKGFIFSACTNIYSVSKKKQDEFLVEWKKELLDDSPLNLFYLNVIGHPSTVMHKKDDSILYDPLFKWVVDVDFYIRFLIKYPGYEYLPETLINIGADENQMSNKYYKNPDVEIPEYLQLLAKYPSKLLLQQEYVFFLVWNLVKRFKIKSVNEIGKFYKGRLPDKIQQIIQFQKYIPNIILKQTPWNKWLMKRCFKKLSVYGLYK
ncbi:MAG: glycosyltransferase [Bacteroidota bacterium]|nr:glycosyltransferase [Bacteroidota bacterium]